MRPLLQICKLTDSISKLAQSSDSEEKRNLKLKEAKQRILLQKLDGLLLLRKMNQITEEELAKVAAKVKDMLNA